ncbi:MAG: magnesium/cobalt transporter CorA [Treponema sp.]|jgi:magnesium transporter|nr:magnesium/cobalt transporter CorA [Treponema sp.]
MKRRRAELIGYDPAGAWEKESDRVEDLFDDRNPAGITWINLNYLDVEAVNTLAKKYRIHPLTVEDILDTEQRPKAEQFDDYIFITLKAIHRKDENHDFEQISIILKEDTVLTFQETPADNFNGIRKRIINDAGRARRAGADYLAYSLMDSVVDEYFAVLDTLSDEIENFGERAGDAGGRDFIVDFQEIRRDLLRLRRAILPLRDSSNHLVHCESNLIHAELLPFLKDLHDNTIRASDMVDSNRELMADVMDVNFAAVSGRTNRIMKVLTIISTIFIPLTFIVGVYGMNFSRMPELQSRYGYPLIWAVMIGIAAGMLIFFKRRRWI